MMPERRTRAVYIRCVTSQSPKGEVGESRNVPDGPMRSENRDRCAYFGRAKRTSEMEHVCGVFRPWESQLLPSSHTHIKADGWRRGEILSIVRPHNPVSFYLTLLNPRSESCHPSYKTGYIYDGQLLLPGKQEKCSIFLESSAA